MKVRKSDTQKINDTMAEVHCLCDTLSELLKYDGAVDQESKFLSRSIKRVRQKMKYLSALEDRILKENHE